MNASGHVLVGELSLEDLTYQMQPRLKTNYYFLKTDLLGVSAINYKIRPVYPT